jgi:hypothetical protein
MDIKSTSSGHFSRQLKRGWETNRIFIVARKVEGRGELQRSSQNQEDAGADEGASVNEEDQKELPINAISGMNASATLAKSPIEEPRDGDLKVKHCTVKGRIIDDVNEITDGKCCCKENEIAMNTKSICRGSTTKQLNKVADEFEECEIGFRAKTYAAPRSRCQSSPLDEPPPDAYVRSSQRDYCQLATSPVQPIQTIEANVQIGCAIEKPSEVNNENLDERICGESEWSSDELAMDGQNLQRGHQNEHLPLDIRQFPFHSQNQLSRNQQIPKGTQEWNEAGFPQESIVSPCQFTCPHVGLITPESVSNAPILPLCPFEALGSQSPTPLHEVCIPLHKVHIDCVAGDIDRK